MPINEPATQAGLQGETTSRVAFPRIPERVGMSRVSAESGSRPRAGCQTCGPRLVRSEPCSRLSEGPAHGEAPPTRKHS